MAAAWLRILLATGAGALRAGALRQGLDAAGGGSANATGSAGFIPGAALTGNLGLGLLHHLGHHAVSHMPTNFNVKKPEGAHLLPAGELTHTPLAPTPFDAQRVREHLSQAASAHLITPGQATVTIDKWTATASSMKFWHPDKKHEQLLDDVLLALSGMQSSIQDGRAEYVFALAAKGDANSIHALASVTSNLKSEDYLGTEVVAVDSVIAGPTAVWPGGLRAELVRKIFDWASATGRFPLVLPAKGDRDYYESLGFDLGDVYQLAMVQHNGYDFEGSSLEESSHSGQVDPSGSSCQLVQA